MNTLKNVEKKDVKIKNVKEKHNNTLIIWDNKKCMSYIGNRSGDTTKVKQRCTKNSNHNIDFCGYHKKSKRYHTPLLKKIRLKCVKNKKITTQTIHKLTTDITNLNKELNKTIELNALAKTIKHKIDTQAELLDKDNLHKLFTLKDSWNEVPFENRINLSNGWWDLVFLINHFTQQLNNTDMENPYPTYPSNPLTRIPFKYEDIEKIKDRLLSNNISVNIALFMFFNATKILHNSWYKEAVGHEDNHSYSMIYYLKKKLRFKHINYKDSQDCLTGHWVTNATPLSEFEELYYNYHEEPFQIYCNAYRTFITNPEREYMYIQLLTTDDEHWSVLDDHTKKNIK
jgi:hypothetical protein